MKRKIPDKQETFVDGSDYLCGLSPTVKKKEENEMVERCDKDKLSSWFSGIQKLTCGKVN